MIIPQGLVDVILSENLTPEQKTEAIHKFALPTVYVDGPLAGQVLDPILAEEDAGLISRAVAKGHFTVTATPMGPAINFFFNKEDL